MNENREQFLQRYLAIEDKEKRKRYLHTRKYMANNQETRLLHSSKQRAKASGLEHTLIKEDIVIPEYCVYLGIKITNNYGCGRVQSNASLDRIDSTKGYTPDNIQIISDLANRMKNDATTEQLIAFAKGVLKLHDRVKPNQTPVNEEQLSGGPVTGPHN